jgi:hypothetical protein
MKILRAGNWGKEKNNQGEKFIVQLASKTQFIVCFSL